MWNGKCVWCIFCWEQIAHIYMGNCVIDHRYELTKLCARAVATHSSVSSNLSFFLIIHGSGSPYLKVESPAFSILLKTDRLHVNCSAENLKVETLTPTQRKRVSFELNYVHQSSK